LESWKRSSLIFFSPTQLKTLTLSYRKNCEAFFQSVPQVEKQSLPWVFSFVLAIERERERDFISFWKGKLFNLLQL
jgi:hypothetical protein